MQKNRYAFLDGIRGIAALFVLTRHTLNYWPWQFYRSYLAVDLFFILSGFVIAHAYDNKLRSNELSLGKFIVVRLIRLYPIFLLSIIMCAAALITGNMQYSHRELAASICLTALFLPSYIHGNHNLFPLNGPYWSLFFELISNFIYAGIRRWLTNILLITIVILTGVCVVLITYFHGNLDVGFLYDVQSGIYGLLRSIYGIFMGLLLYRYHEVIHRKIRNIISPWLAVFVVALILSSSAAAHFNRVIDVVVVIIVFPVCVLIASTNTTSKLDRLLLGLGAISYPIYVFHKPLGEIISSLLHGLDGRYAPYSGIVLVSFLIGLSLLLEKCYDIPIRRWLTRCAFKRD